LQVKAKPLFKVAEIYCAGSTGKGTAISLKSDLDVVVFINGLPANKHEQWLHVVLAMFQGLFKQIDEGGSFLVPS
jgi:tRNA nucleotidyltransferase (CCA-adding enzyme)